MLMMIEIIQMTQYSQWNDDYQCLNHVEYIYIERKNQAMRDVLC